MDSADVLAFLRLLDDHQVHYWLDGGWGVDCLLGEQTRPHRDLDLVVPRPALQTVRDILTRLGFHIIRDWLPTSIAFGDGQGREVDLHPVDLTADGGGDQVLPGDPPSWHYSGPVEGTVAGHVVRCSPASDQLLMHQGYEPRPVDVADVRRLAQRFALPLPAPFAEPHHPFDQASHTSLRPGPPAA